MGVCTCKCEAQNSENSKRSRSKKRYVGKRRTSKICSSYDLISFQSDQVPVGSIPRTLTVNIYGEATRQCAPGDHVRISGVLIPLMRSGFRQGGGGLVAETFLEAHVCTFFVLVWKLWFSVVRLHLDKFLVRRKYPQQCWRERYWWWSYRGRSGTARTRQSLRHVSVFHCSGNLWVDWR